MTSRIAALLIVAVAAATGACRSTGATPHPFPMRAAKPPARLVAPPSTSEAPPSSATPSLPTPSAPPDQSPLAATPATDADRLVDTALALIGRPYRNGGADPEGFDCSGFTRYVFGQYGVPLPRGVKEQFEVGVPVKAEELAPGDLVFFTTVASGASHVGISLGGDRFVHAPSSAGVVRIEHASAAYWSRRYVGARRVPG